MLNLQTAYPIAINKNYQSLILSSLKNLGLASPIRSQNPDKIIINHSSYHSSDIEKTFLAKGLDFPLPPKKLT